MSRTWIRGNTQIMPWSVTLDRTWGYDGNTSTGFLTTSTGAAKDWDMTNGAKDATITGLRNPTADSDAATKVYVDSVAQGLDPKESVRLATVAALPSHTQSGAGQGATLIGSSTGQLYIDGIAVNVDDRILVKNETSTGAAVNESSENGIYIVTSTGASGGWVLTRAEDWDGYTLPGVTEQLSGSYTWIEEGNTISDTAWVCITDEPITVDTTGIKWTQFGGAGTYTASLGVKKVGNDFQADLLSTGAIGLSTNSMYVRVDNTTIGINGSNNLYVIAPPAHTHSLASGDITDVDVTGATAGDILIRSSDGNWYDRTMTGDVHITSTGVTEIQDDAVQASDIDWGLGSDQVNASDVPTDTTNFDTILSSADDTVQKALDTLDDHNHGSTYTSYAFRTIIPKTGNNAVADQIHDTLYLRSTTGVVEINGIDDDIIDFDVADSAITETHLNTSVAGSALSGGGGSSLDVQVDGTTIHVNGSNQLEVIGTTREVIGEYVTVTHNSPTCGAVANIPIKSGTLAVYLNGERVREGASHDYTVNYTTGVITFNYNLKAPSGQPDHWDQVCVDYRY